MSTTTLFVEILIVGLEAFVWIGLIVGMDSARNVVQILKDMKDYSALVTIIVLATAYIIGIFMDRIADSCYKIFRYKRNISTSVGVMRLKVMKESEALANFLDYQRTRLRIARATIFNLFLTLFVGAVWIGRNYLSTKSTGNLIFELLMIGTGIFILYVVIKVTRRIDEAQINRLEEAYELVAGDKT